MAFCSKCGAAMEDDNKFCMMCGTPRETQPVNSVPVMETPVVNPVPVMETPVVNPVPVMETPVVNPVPVMETPVVNPVPVMETPVVDSVPAMETPVVNSMPVMEESVVATMPVAEENVVDEPVEKVAVSLRKESEPVQPEMPQTGFAPIQPEMPQQGFVPVQPEMPQAGFVPTPSAPQQAYNTQPSYQQAYGAVPNGPRKSKKGPIIAIISAGVVAIAAIVIALILLLGSKTAEVDLSKYVNITYEGYDTTGTAYVTIDKTTLLVDILKAQGKDTTSVSSVSYSMKALMNSIEIEEKYYEDLTNGQKINIEVKFDKLLMEENDVEFKNAVKDYTVESLEELIEVDPFKDVTLKFSGTSPAGYVYYNNASDIDCVRWASMEFDKDSDLKNGDTVTLRVSPDSIENAVKKGYKFTVTSKEYKVEGLSYYYNSLDEISDEHMKKYEEAAKEAVDDALEWTYDITVTDVKLIGKYFGKSKVYPSNNKIVFVYSATATSTDGSFDTTTIYIPAIMKVGCIEEGNIDYIYAYTSGSIRTEIGWGSCSGFVSGDLMYTELINNEINTEDYEVTASKDMPQFVEATGENRLPAPGQSGTDTDTENGATEDSATEDSNSEQTPDAPVEDAESNN